MNLKKTLVAAAVAAVAAVPAASFASGTMYGAVELGMTQQGKTSDTGKASTSFFDNGSRIGFKGSNDLGNGLTGIYQLELGIDTFNGQSPNSGGSAYAEPHGHSLKTRLGYMGVKGSFGTVVAGRQHGLYYSIVNAPTDTPNVLAGPLNPIALANGSMGGYESRVNAIAYVSPNFSGFSGGLAYADVGTYDQTTCSNTFYNTLTGGSCNSGTPTSQYGKQQGVYQIGGKYTFGPGYVGLAYMGIPQDNVKWGFMQDVLGLSAGYSFGAFGVDGNFQQATPRTSGPEGLTGNNNNKKVQSFALQGSYSMGALYAYVEYSQMKWKYISNKTAHRTVAGVFYNVAKPLQVTFEVSNNNKYVASTLAATSTDKAYTTFAIGANYHF